MRDDNLERILTRLRDIEKRLHNQEMKAQPFRFSSADNTFDLGRGIRVTRIGVGLFPTLTLQAANGTVQTPVTLSSGSFTGRIAFNGFTGSAYITAARILASAETISGADITAGKLTFEVKQDATTFNTMEFTKDGLDVSTIVPPLGINTNSPGGTLHVIASGAVPAVFQVDASGNQGNNVFYHPDTTDGNQCILNFATDTTGTGASTNVGVAGIRAIYTTHNQTTRAAGIAFFTSQASSQQQRMRVDAGVQIGSPSGGDPGSGALATASDITAGGSIFANAETGPRLQMKTLTVNNGATAQLPHVSGSGAGTAGFLFISRNTACAIYILRGGSNTTQEISDPDNQFSPTSGTASSTNIYWSAGNSRYEIQNNSGGNITYRMWFMVF